MFKNPYLIGEQVTENHIQAGQYALLKQDGVKVEWPGCDTCIDFRMMAEPEPTPHAGGDEYDEDEFETDDDLDCTVKLVTVDDEVVYGEDLIDMLRRIAFASYSLPDSFLLGEGPGAAVKDEDVEAFGGDLVYLVRRMAELARAMVGRPSPNFSRCPLGSREDLEGFGEDLLDLIERVILDEFEAPHLAGIVLSVFVREA